jgi:hypothetical protein
MKKLLFITFMIFGFISTYAQENNDIKFDETKGELNYKGTIIKEGTIFKITSDVDKDCKNIRMGNIEAMAMRIKTKKIAGFTIKCAAGVKEKKGKYFVKTAPIPMGMYLIFIDDIVSALDNGEISVSKD